MLYVALGSPGQRREKLFCDPARIPNQNVMLAKFWPPVKETTNNNENF